MIVCALPLYDLHTPPAQPFHKSVHFYHLPLFVRSLNNKSFYFCFVLHCAPYPEWDIPRKSLTITLFVVCWGFLISMLNVKFLWFSLLYDIRELSWKYWSDLAYHYKLRDTVIVIFSHWKNVSSEFFFNPFDVVKTWDTETPSESLKSLAVYLEERVCIQLREEESN